MQRNNIMVRVWSAMVSAIVIFLLAATATAQPCKYLVHGVVTDDGHHPVPGVIVRLMPDSVGMATDTTGSFSFSNVCQGTHKISFEAVGYKKLEQATDVTADKYFSITLSTSDNELGDVVISGEKVHELRTVLTDELKGKALLQTRGATLGESLKELPGLNSVQTGPGLSKPVIHGLHSNRVLIINNGIRQEGQQWGSDHTPEIDPFTANKITVVKGAASVRYGADAVGGVILLDPDPLPTTPGIHGNVYAIGASNGRVGTTSGMLQGAFGKKLEGLSWRVQGTYKQAGNFETPHYYLFNTGLKENDFSGTLGYKKKGFNFSVFYSHYNTQTGIFSGAQSNSPADLAAKMARSTPDVPSYFSYTINRSYQQVSHGLLKATAGYTFKNNAKVDMTFGRQEDLREEYDAGLPFTTSAALLAKPQLSFTLVTHSLDLVYTSAVRSGFSGTAGITGNTSGNVFSGLRYLIPNYRDYNAGAFAIERYNRGKFNFEAGLRYDYRWLRVYQRNANTLQLYNTTYGYNNVTGTIGATYHYNAHLSFTGNVGTAWRAPSINEMYINGEHFSNASYEVGDSSLKSERSLNTSLSVNYTNSKLRITADMYYNKIGNYIYAKPALASVTIISGTYPLFLYTQTNANIKGLDASLQYDLTNHLTFQSKTTIVLGYNESAHDYLVFMPANRYENGITYQGHKLGKLDEPYIGVENVTVSKQSRVPPNSDFAPPPAGYSLFNINGGFTMPLLKHLLTVSASVNNTTNVAYRDYLNRFRYYADDLGASYVLRLKYSF